MTSLDLVLGGIIAAFAGIGVLRGVIVEAMSLAVWVLAGAVAWFFAEDAAPWFSQTLLDPEGQRILAFVALFVVSFIALTFGNFLLRIVLLSPMLSLWHRAFGGVLGAVRGTLLASILVALAGLTRLPQESWWRDSELAPPLQMLTLTLVSRLPSDLAAQFRY